ncbi:hypothetical protein EYC84_005298 [Monilinia fructicola]|uniref:Uncharacterized protein n=1 Tax=Monilinia fructicola TaxID=38448 RepID=A0A5M9K165_MONFR|nr:hypothetical protein EYC84_005298 [Monilinia fructicola]
MCIYFQLKAQTTCELMHITNQLIQTTNQPTIQQTIHIQKPNVQNTNPPSVVPSQDARINKVYTQHHPSISHPKQKDTHIS